jgi:ABC-type uncharacterized transport system auxiliary subunit
MPWITWAPRRLPATDTRLTAIIDAYNAAAGTALAEIVEDTAATLTRSLEGR